MTTKAQNKQDERLGAGTGAVMEMNNESVEAPKKKKNWLTWIEKVGRRNWIIVGAVLIIGVAVWLNWAFFSDSTAGGYAGYGDGAGMTGGEASGGAGENTVDYFATVQVNRQRARDEAMAVLQQVIDNPDATETVKNEALAELNAIADEIEKEANIEALLVSGGFEDCVAVMNGDAINVIVKSEGELQTAQIAKINTVVYEQTGIAPIGVTIVHKN